MISFLRKHTPRPLKPFKSPAAALRWYEWRMFRPFFLTNILYMLTILFICRVIFFDYYIMNIWHIMMFPVMMTLITGIVFVFHNYRQQCSGAAVFVFSRPVLSSSLSYTRLLTSVIHCLFLAIQIGAIAALIAISIGFFEYEALNDFEMTHRIAVFGDIVEFLVSMCFICWLIFWWASRKNLVYLSAGGISLGSCILINSTLYPDVYGEPYFDYWLPAMIFLVIAGSVHSYIQAWRTRVVNAEILIIAFILWLFLGSVPFLAYNGLLPPYNDYTMLFLGWALLAFVFEPFASTPLAWHRKRCGGGKLQNLLSFPLSPERRRRYRMGLVVFFVALPAGWILFRGYAAYRLNHELVAIKKNPFLQPEYLKVIYPEVPPDENAALIYKEAFKLIREKSNTRKFSNSDHAVDTIDNHLRICHAESIDAKYLNRLQKEVKQYDDVFVLLDQAATMRKSRFFDTLDHRPDRSLFGSSRFAFSLLQAKAILAVNEGNTHGAIDELRSFFALYRAIAQEPVFDLHWSLYFQFHSNYRALNYLLNHLVFTDQQIEELQMIMVENFVPPSKLAAICVAFPWQWSEYNKDVITTSPGENQLGAWYRWSGMHDLERAVFLSFINGVFRGISGEDLKKLNDMPAMDTYNIPLGWWRRINNPLYAWLYFFQNDGAKELAVQRMACAALAIERYRSIAKAAHAMR